MVKSMYGDNSKFKIMLILKEARRYMGRKARTQVTLFLHCFIPLTITKAGLGKRQDLTELAGEQAFTAIFLYRSACWKYVVKKKNTRKQSYVRGRKDCSGR